MVEGLIPPNFLIFPANELSEYGFGNKYMSLVNLFLIALCSNKGFLVQWGNDKNKIEGAFELPPIEWEYDLVRERFPDLKEKVKCITIKK